MTEGTHDAKALIMRYSIGFGLSVTYLAANIYSEVVLVRETELGEGALLVHAP